MYPLIIIVGPTAVGKSALGIRLAQKFNGEIISGDSVQVYKRLDIGSAKPTQKEMQGIPHHLIDYLEPNEPFTAAQFQKIGNELIQRIRENRRYPIIVGGTGLYIRSIIDPYTFVESGYEPIRKKWTAFLNEFGQEALHYELSKCDANSAKLLHPNDIVRIIRALEIYELTGQPASAQRENLSVTYAPLSSDIIYIGLTALRDVIYQRINERCELMLKQGLLEETKKLLEQGFAQCKPLKSIGYRHAIWQLKGLVTENEMIRIFKRDTRHFAKRQLTWFKRDPRIKWYDTTIFNIEDIVTDLAKTCALR